MANIMSNVIGYVFDEKGRYNHKYYFEGTYDNIARFIMQYGAASPRLMITDMVDEALITTYGIYVDKAADETVLKDLLSALHPLQHGQRYKKLKFHESEPYVMELKDSQNRKKMFRADYKM